MREEVKTGISRGAVAGLYVAALFALTQAPQVTDWTDAKALVSFITGIGVAFLGPLSFLAERGRHDAEVNSNGS